jgi:hypothetical protein
LGRIKGEDKYTVSTPAAYCFAAKPLDVRGVAMVNPVAGIPP